MSEQNVRLARRWFEEVWNQRRVETVRELLTTESVCRSESAPLAGPDQFLERAYYPFIGAFPDLRIEIEGTVADGDEVVVRWKAQGTHSGDALGFPATGRRVSFHGMTWARILDGKLAEGSDCWNLGGVIDALRSGRASGSIQLSE